MVRPPQSPNSQSTVNDSSATRSLVDQAIARAAGARLIAGNRVRLLRDAAENYPAWLQAISAAEHYVYFESYIIRDDRSGRQFADALIAKARAGVRVRLLYDWLGAVGKTPSRFWSTLRDSGVEVRCFNPFTLTSPLGWVRRDHRKSLVVDGSVGFVTGLCVGDDWVGHAERGIPPWRDTGLELRGPVVTEVDRAFRKMWALTGDPIPEDERNRATLQTVGDVDVRVVASEPAEGGLLRVDELVAAAARHTLWLTDAYFVGIPSYVQALRAAALDGVDVRLLVPGETDIPILRHLSRAGYRPLLDASVRIFEWNGSMLHAKSAVADGAWARVGSTNLNLASWMGNYELDAIIEDEDFAKQMEEQYENDLTNATEIVLTARHRVTHPRRRKRGVRSAGRATAGAMRLTNTVSAAVTHHRVLAPAEARIVALIGGTFAILALVAFQWPMLLAWPLAVVFAWFALSLLLEAYRLRQAARAKARHDRGSP